MNRKGITLYLGLNYLLVIVVSFVCIGEGLLVFQKPNVFQYLLQAVLMGIPALCAFAAAQFAPDTIDERLPIWPVPAPAALRATIAAPVLFAVSYSIAALLGITHPQWGLGGLMNRVTAQLSAPLAPGVEAAAPVVALVVYPIISILIGATLFAFIALGSEIGWRGYLLPRLLPLGRIPAYGITGLCWGLWFLPLVYGWYREAGQAGTAETMVRVIALAMVLSAVLGNVVRRTRHLGVTALWLGGFAGQATGIWAHLFEQASPPWTGTLGWINIGVWGMVAVVTWKTPPVVNADELT